MNGNLIKYITNVSNYGRTAFEYLMHPKNISDKQILDPLTTIIKISLLYFYKDGAKLRIFNNSIDIQKANNFQGILRWSYGESRDKLYNLKEPIRNCLTWFPHQRYPNLKIIYGFAILGLEKLKNSYSQSSKNITIHLIEYYIKIIKDHLENTNNDNINIENSIILNDNLQKSIKTIWTKDDIALIDGFFEILIKRSDDGKDINNIFLSLLQFLKEKDNQIKTYIIKYTTELKI